MITLLVKVTLLLAAGLIALLTTRRATAGMRHLLCVCTLAGSLILPVAALLPTKTITVRLTSINGARVARSQAIGRSSLGMAVVQMCFFALWAIGTAFLLLRARDRILADPAALVGPARLLRRECMRPLSRFRSPPVCCGQWSSCLAPPRNGPTGRERLRYAMSARISNAAI